MSQPDDKPRAASHIVRHLLDDMAKRHALRGSAPRDEVSAAVRLCLGLLTCDVDGRAAGLARIERAAARWARLGVPVDTVQHLVREGFTLYLDSYRRPAFAAGGDPRAELRGLLDALHAVTAAVSSAYVAQLTAADGPADAAPEALTAALLGGRPASTIAREQGVPIADRYLVLAVAAAGPDPDERTTVRRTHSLLRDFCGQPVPALLSPAGGTILVPSPPVADPRLDDLVARLAAVARRQLTAAAVDARPDRIPVAAGQAHELLDVVARLGGAPGLYRFDEMALEYQITRPGPGRDRLGALLDPLADHPELLDTLREHIGNNLNRQRTARKLFIHTNTVDNRIKRIGDIVGLDVTQPSGIWRLRAALIARTYTEDP